MIKMTNIVVIELDGGSWNVINPLIQQGKLPNMQQLIRNGVSGDLLSDPPLLSPRLWVSIFTGKHSRKHGVEFFGNSSSMVKCKRIWDIFHEKGHTVGVFGSFVTWPPYPVNGFMIPSLFALGPETYPEKYRFLQELTLNERKRGKADSSSSGKRRSSLYYAIKMISHGVSFKTLLETAFHIFNDRIKRSPKDEKHWKHAIMHLKISTEILLHLYKQYHPAFTTFHIHLCDALSHRYWKYYEPDKFQDVDPKLLEKYKDVIPKAYVEADRMIGKIMQLVGDAVTIVISDHGSIAMDSPKMAYRLHVDNFLNRFQLREKVIPANMGLMTFCYFHDSNLMKQMQAIFEKVIFSDTGEKVFDVLKEESLIGLRLSPSLWGREIQGEKPIDLHEFGRCTFSDLFLVQKMETSGTHKREGIVIISGPGIKKGIHIDGASIYDITPTSLALAGFPVAKDMDGKVLEQVMDDEFLRKKPIKYIMSYEESSKQPVEDTEKATYEKMKRQLKYLGYL
jgi:predicted AlkP superfamily phosphohydrolase/phosphomutase